jgi:hypothetical protein
MKIKKNKNNRPKLTIFLISSLLITSISVLSNQTIGNATATEDTASFSNLLWNSSMIDQDLTYTIRLSSVIKEGDSIFTYSRASLSSRFSTSIQKWSTDGQLEWSKIWNISVYSDSSKLCSDGTNLYGTGRYKSNSMSMDYNIFVAKWDLNGNMVKNITIDSYNGRAQDIISLNDYLYIIGINQSSPSNDVILLKYNKDLQIQWSSTWGESGNEWCTSINTDGTNLYISAQTDSFGLGSTDAAILKYDVNGALLWNKTTGSSEWDAGRGIWCDGTYVYLSGTANGSLFITKWNNDGTLIWNKTEIMTDVTDSEQALIGDGDDIFIATTNNALDVGIVYKINIDGSTLGNLTWDVNEHDCRFIDMYLDDNYLYLIGFEASGESGGSWLISIEIISDGIPGFNIIYIFGIFIISAFILSKKMKNKKENG